MTTAPRRLILVDIENFNGQPIQSPEQAEWCKEMLTPWLNIKEDEITIIAADKSGILDVNVGWKGPRLLMGMGPDGADRRLIEEIEYMNFDQFDEIALVSGDEAFAAPVAYAAARGVPTTVYSHEIHLSRRLQLAASSVHFTEDAYSRNTAAQSTTYTLNTNPAQLSTQIQEAA